MSEAFRKDLRSRVRSLWTQKGFELQESLKARGRELLKEDYKRCATEVPASEFKNCLYDVAEAKNLADEYRAIWGTK